LRFDYLFISKAGFLSDAIVRSNSSLLKMKRELFVEMPLYRTPDGYFLSLSQHKQIVRHRQTPDDQVFLHLGSPRGSGYRSKIEENADNNAEIQSRNVRKQRQQINWQKNRA